MLQVILLLVQGCNGIGNKVDDNNYIVYTTMNEFQVMTLDWTNNTITYGSPLTDADYPATFNVITLSGEPYGKYLLPKGYYFVGKVNNTYYVINYISDNT